MLIEEGESDAAPVVFGELPGAHHAEGPVLDSQCVVLVGLAAGVDREDEDLCSQGALAGKLVRFSGPLAPVSPVNTMEECLRCRQL